MNVNDLHTLYVNNAWPAMLDVLGAQLGVSRASLSRLGVGFAPIVTFVNKKLKTTKISYGGWWSIPERDEFGAIKGLGLRSREGAKTMTSGSKHALIYPLSDAYVVGGGAGPNDDYGFIRTMEAGVDCPKCGKPDGCLVSAENELDPRAVICIRVREGAIRPMKFGYLHHRKPHEINRGSPLPESEFPVIVVEGMSDTATAMDLGFVAVGRPAAFACLDMLVEVLRGRRVIIVGENDKEDARGRRAGQEGMESVFETLKPICPSVVRVLPPPDVKDLRAWKDRYKLTPSDFLGYVEKFGSSERATEVLEKATPLPLALKWLKQYHMDGDSLLLRKYHGQWYRFQNNRYEELDEDEMIRGRIYAFLKDKKYLKTMPDGTVVVEDYEPTRNRIHDIVDAMNICCPISGEPPCWIDNRVEPDPKDLLCFQNGILDVGAYLRGESSLATGTPHLFSLTALPYDFDPEAECKGWCDWLMTVFGGDESKVKLLQEWFGYCMIPDMSMEKMMFLVGAPGTGKGTTLEVQQALIGRDQVAVTRFSSIANEYGRAPLVGKLVAQMTDARLPRHGDSMAALETLLAIVGRDGVNINRKHRDELPHHKLMTRFTIAVNELPELPDHSQALQRRLLMLHYEAKFDAVDTGMKTRLCNEVAGIATWALEGLRRLRENKTFTLPESSKILIDEFRKVTSPMTAFVEDCCELDETRQRNISKTELFDAWVAWCHERGLQAGYRSKFNNRLEAAFPLVRGKTATVLGKWESFYEGIDLQPWAKTNFLGKPGG